MKLSISIALVGITGLALSGSLLLVTTWRTFFHCWSCFRRGERRSFAMFTPRRIFHSLLWLAMTVETVAYSDLAGLLPLSHDRAAADKLGYVLLEVFGRSICEFIAFSVVTLLWFETAIQARFRSRDEINACLACLPKVLLGLICLLVCVSLIQAGDILLAGTPYQNGQYQGSTLALRSHLLIEGLSWGFHALLAMLCGVITAKRILYLSTWSQSGIMTRLRLMVKALLPMILCALCYATRSIWLITQFTTMPVAPTHSARRSNLGWWIGFVWIPTFLPSCMLLYSARKRDRLSTIGDESYTSPLLPMPVPPAEAFISFRRFTEHCGEILSPFTPLRTGGNDDDDDDTIDFLEDEGSIQRSRDGSILITMDDRHD